MQRPNDRQIKCLEMLGFFQYLTISQFGRLGYAKYRSNFTNLVISKLKQLQYIDVISFNGKEYENIYFLTDKGCDLLAEQNGVSKDILKRPKRKPDWSVGGYYHRKYEIDCQVECFLSSKRENVPIVFYDTELERIDNQRKENNLEKRTRVDTNFGYLEPDSIFLLETQNGKKLFALELERRDNRTKSQLDEKLNKHVSALNLKAVSQKYGHDKGYRILFVCEHQPTRDYMIDYLLKNVSNCEFWFLFKLYSEVYPTSKKGNKIVFEENPELNLDFFTNWLTIEDLRISMF